MKQSPSHPQRSLSIFYLIPILILTRVQVTSTNAEGTSCTSNLASFYCPNCNGIQVNDCNECEGYLFPDNRHEICYNRKLFNVKNHESANPDNHYPFLWNDIMASLVWFLTAGLATACGVGGGGIYVPMGILLLRFPPKASTGLSQASIFGASLGGWFINIRKRHPEEYIRDIKENKLAGHDKKAKSISPRDENDASFVTVEIDNENHRTAGGDGKRMSYGRPVIAYDMALFLSPMVMAGAVCGVFLQSLFPDWLFLSFAAVVLGFTSYKTFKKFAASYKEDKAKNLALKQGRIHDARGTNIGVKNSHTFSEEYRTESSIGANDLDPDVSVTNQKERKNCHNANVDRSVILEEVETPDLLERRRHFLEDDARQYPKEKIAYLGLLWIGLSIITFLKGGRGIGSVVGITCEEAAFYILVASQFLWTFGFAAFFGWRIMKRTEARSAVAYPFIDSDVLWDFKKVRFYSFFTFLAGIVAGLVGIGGGMVLGPLMLVMGVHPSVSAATNATMVLLTSSSVAVIFVLSGSVPLGYALFFFFVCLLGSCIGKTKIDSYVKRTGMTSLLIGALAIIIGIATIGCVTIMLMNLRRANWCLDGFQEFCSVDGFEQKCPTQQLLSQEDDGLTY